MSDRVLEFENTAECENCGERGAYDLSGTSLCLDCISSEPDNDETVAYFRDECVRLREENERLGRMLKTRDNKIKHLRQQLSESKLRKRLEQQSNTVREMGERLERLKREKVALHEYVERQQRTSPAPRPTGDGEGEG